MADPSLIEQVTRRRAEQVQREVSSAYPDAQVRWELERDRGIITAVVDRFVISKEFVEPEGICLSPHRMYEYGRILLGKARLVLVVPKSRAVDVRFRLLEFNRMWLFYYLVFFYDENGNIHRLDRVRWMHLMGREPKVERSPEVV